MVKFYVVSLWLNIVNDLDKIDGQHLIKPILKVKRSNLAWKNYRAIESKELI